MISRIAKLVSLRYRLANDESTAIDIAEKVRESFESELRLPMNWSWDNKYTTDIKGGKHGEFSFAARPIAWDTAQVRDEKGVGRLSGGLLFLGSYDKLLKSNSPTGPARKDWAESGGNESSRGLIVPFGITVGYYSKKRGHGIMPEYSVELAGGLLEVVDQYENLEVHFENLTSDASSISDLVQSCIDSPPEGSLEYEKVPVRNRLKK